MAKKLGKAGRYTRESVAHDRRNGALVGVFVITAFLEGVTLSSFWAGLHPPDWLNTAAQWSGLIGVAVLYRWGTRKRDELDVNGGNCERRTDGESVVAKVLAKLPHEYHVINDLNTPSGNLDHVVVGPTGVFVLAAKNWRGLVSADGKGELMLNGKRTKKREIGAFVSRVMSVREKVSVLAPGRDHYFQAVFVFTAASIDAKPGTTGRVHCISEKQLHEYIVEKSFGSRLDRAAVKSVAQAFRGLAHMQQDFTEKATREAASRPAVRLGQPEKANVLSELSGSVQKSQPAEGQGAPPSPVAFRWVSAPQVEDEERGLARRWRFAAGRGSALPMTFW